MQAHPGILGEGLEPFLEQFGVHLAQLGLGDGDVPHQIGPVGDINRHPGERFVHGDQGAAKTADAGKIAQRLFHGLADDDGGVFGGVVEIDMQVAGSPHLEVDHGMAAKAVQHMVQEADAGINVAHPGAIQVERDADIGFAGFAFNSGGTHGNSSDLQRV